MSRLLDRRVRLISISILGCVILLFLFGFFDQTSSFGSNAVQTRAIHNRTLGFQRVFALSLPSRPDRRDALIIAGSCSNIDITWSDGVKFQDLDRKAIPATFDERFFAKEDAETSLGCWRGHLNVLSTIVRENIATALILEDDADWDISLKDQLEQFAIGINELQSAGNSPRGSPYGSNWDMLWLGAGRTGPVNTIEAQDMYFIHNDSTVPPLIYRNGTWDNEHIPPEVFANDTRIIFRAGRVIGLRGYAITLAGAQRALTALSLLGGRGNEIDLELFFMCNDHPDMALSLICYSIYPQIVGSHRFAGPESHDSDIQTWTEYLHDDFTKDIAYSAIKNAPRFLGGEADAINQWDPTKTRRFDEKYAVYGERRRIDLGALPKQTIVGVNCQDGNALLRSLPRVENPPEIH